MARLGQMINQWNIRVNVCCSDTDIEILPDTDTDTDTVTDTESVTDTDKILDIGIVTDKDTDKVTDTDTAINTVTYIVKHTECIFL